MNNFNPKLQDATDEELMSMVNKLVPTFATLASDELTRRSIKKLNETIIKGAEQSEKSTKTTEDFTRAMYLLTVVQILIGICQFYMSFAYTDNIRLMVNGVSLTLVLFFVILFISSKLPSKDYKNIK